MRRVSNPNKDLSKSCYKSNKLTVKKYILNSKAVKPNMEAILNSLYLANSSKAKFVSNSCGQSFMATKNQGAGLL